MLLSGNRTIEESIAAVKWPGKVFENVCALLQGLLGESTVESLVSIGIRAENARMPRPPVLRSSATAEGGEGRGASAKQKRSIVGMDEPLDSLESLIKPPLVNGEGQPKASGSG
jgi:hypothetical protein